MDRLRAAGCVYAEDEAALLSAEAGDQPTRLEDLVARRVGGEPLEHLLGWAQFAGRRLVVAPGVFVPRRRTELLAREAVVAAAARPATVLVELCCGVAAVATVVAAGVPGCEVYAVDDDPAAVACAGANLGEAGTVLLGDLATPLPDGLRGRVGVLLANPPHVPTAELALLPPEAREHESGAALDGGPDGLAVLRRIIALAGDWLAPDGVLLLEAGREQARRLASELAVSGWRSAVLTDEAVSGTVLRAGIAS